MRRLVSTFLTLWIGLFVPMLIISGLMLRWSAAAADRFETVWRWSADRLAFPLVLEPQIEWSWQAIGIGSPLHATSAFVFLTAVWALMFALPLALVGWWWMWLVSRGARSQSSVALTEYDAYATTPILPASTGSSLHSPVGALYIVTIPFAVLWAGVRWITRPLRSTHHPVLSFFAPVLLCQD